MLGNPHGNVAEAFRVLRANVDLVNVDRGAAVIMVTSAFEREGRSEVTANLAVAFARAGRHVILVDLDLRQPSLARVFGLPPEPGLTDVAFGTTTRSRTLAEIPLGGPSSNGRSVSGTGDRGSEGKLEVLVAGRTFTERSEFVGTHAVAELLATLRRESDLVLLDAPPMLSGGDAIALGTRADAVIAVVRLNDLRRATLDELGRVLQSSPAVKLGVVVTGADDELPPEQRSSLPTDRTRQALAVWRRIAEAALAVSAKKRVR
jgi:Mrp family chromosome partitioning ATPase